MTSFERRHMHKEGLIQDIFNQMCNKKEIDKSMILDFLTKNYKSDSSFPEGFDKIHEMGQMLSLVERIKEAEIKAGTEFPKRYDASKDIIKAVIYCTALIESRKHKIDIFKVKDDFGIDDLFAKYEIREENTNEN